MQRQNLFELEAGLNIFEFDAKDLPLFSQNLPVLSLPAGRTLSALDVEINSPVSIGHEQFFGGSGQPAESWWLRVGTQADNDSFLTLTNLGQNPGTRKSGDGAFWSSPTTWSTSIQILLSLDFEGCVWTIGPVCPYVRVGPGSGGNRNSGLVVSGYNGSYLVQNDEWDGSVWSTAGGFSNWGRYGIGASGNDQASILNCGGRNGSSYFLNAETYNGSSWAIIGSMSVARAWHGCSGTPASAAAFGGTNGATLSSTEKYNGSTWSTSGSLNTARQAGGFGAFGSSALSISGWNGTNYFSSVEEFNGATWSTSTSVNFARKYPSGGGKVNSGLFFGGSNSTSPLFFTEHFDGTTWRMGGNLNMQKDQAAGFGSTRAALSTVGQGTSPYLKATEIYQPISESKVAKLGSFTLFALVT